MTDDIDALLARLSRTAIKLETEDWNDDASAVDEAATAIRSLRAQLAAATEREAAMREALRHLLDGRAGCRERARSALATTDAEVRSE